MQLYSDSGTVGAAAYLVMNDQSRFESVQIGLFVTVTFGALFRLTIGRETTCTHTNYNCKVRCLSVWYSESSIALIMSQLWLID